uniref:Signal recognition particle subunit SRP72 n=1 Tax=Meloidogyne hapla TaxID=6305 RepID=A0A1I8BEC9_MELHA
MNYSSNELDTRKAHCCLLRAMNSTTDENRLTCVREGQRWLKKAEQRGELGLYGLVIKCYQKLKNKNLAREQYNLLVRMERCLELDEATLAPSEVSSKKKGGKGKAASVGGGGEGNSLPPPSTSPSPSGPFKWTLILCMIQFWLCVLELFQ